MDIQNISLIIVTLINLFWGLVLFFYRPIKKSNILFSLIIFSVIFWTVAIIFYRVVNISASALLLARILYFSATLIPLFFLYFTFIFPKQKKIWNKYLMIGIAIPTVIIFYLTIFTDSILSGVDVVSGGENIIYFGKYFLFYAFYQTIYFLSALIILFFNIFKTSGEEKTQVKFVFTGFFLSIIIAMTTNLFMPWFGYFDLHWFGQSSTVIFISFSAFALIRHYLTDIKVIGTELFSGLIIVVSFVYIFESKDLLELAIRISVFIVTFVFSILLIKSVLKEVHRREEVEKVANDLKRATKDLISANKELERLDDVKSEFLSIASHQLRTPLTVVKGYVSMILEGSFGKSPEAVKANLEKVYASTETLIRLVEDLLNVSRVESNRVKFDIKLSDLADVANQAVEEFREKADKKGLKLEFIADKNLPKVSIDPMKIKEVIAHIIDNSIKYTPKGSITAKVYQDKNSIVFTCEDTGMGIISEDLPRLFEKFVRGQGMMQVHTEGTGLGMYFARMIVDKMGGRIWAESQGKEKGSKFLFSLPIAKKNKSKKK